MSGSMAITPSHIVPGLGPGIHAYGTDARVGWSHVDIRVKSAHDGYWLSNTHKSTTENFKPDSRRLDGRGG